MLRRLSLAIVLAGAAFSSLAVDTPTWPPSPEVLGRMRELQAAIADPGASKEDRARAKLELERLMKSPAGAARTDEATKKPARAAIDPFPSVVKPAETRLPAPPTARLEVIPDDPPRRPLVNPATGSVVVPASPGIAVDTRTGRLLQETPNGYVDPQTGRFVPK